MTKTCTSVLQASAEITLPAVDITTQPIAVSSSLDTPLTALTLQQSDCSDAPQPCITLRMAQLENLTTAQTVQEPLTPVACKSPRIQSYAAKGGSPAAMTAHLGKSPFVQPIARQCVGQSAVRRSADAVLITAPSDSGSHGKASALRQARQRKSLQAIAASAADTVDDVTAAVRRSRVSSVYNGQAPDSSLCFDVVHCSAICVAVITYHRWWQHSHCHLAVNAVSASQLSIHSPCGAKM